MITISFIVFNVVAVVKNLLAGNIRAFFAPLSDMSFVISIVYLGVLSSLVTSLMTNYVLSKMEASRMGVFVNLGTVVTIIAGIMFLKEEFYYYHVIGSILVIGGVLGANYLKRIS
jgi:drug/metabolite transporter (DMT)-like permease